MKGLEFFRNVSIGQYFAGDSPIHRLTPATKYLWLLALAIPGAAGGLAAVILSGIAALAVGAAAGLRPGFLIRGVKPALPFFVLAALLQFLFGWPGDSSTVLLSLGPFSATLREAEAVGMAVCRTVSLMAVIGLFTSVTSEGEIAHGLEDVLSPLAKLGLPVHRLALVASATFRFIPVIAMELEAIVKAQASRGADFGTGRGGPLAKARAYLPLIVPVTVRALERAEALAEAMEARCYTGDGRTRLVTYGRRRGELLVDLAAPLACAAAFAADALLRWALAILGNGRLPS
jgi:energy-coupling factor transport system permease protein